MGYFDGIADAAFKTNDRGQTVFYVNGIFGKGHILASPGQHLEIRDFLKKMYMVLLVGVILLQIAFGLVANIIFGALWTAVFYYKIRDWTKDLETTEEKLKMSEAHKNSARSHNLPTLIFLTCTSLLLTLIGLVMITEEPVMGTLCTLFFGFCTLMIGKMLRIKLEERRQVK